MCVDYSVGKRYEERAAMVRTGEYGKDTRLMRRKPSDVERNVCIYC